MFLPPLCFMVVRSKGLVRFRNIHRYVMYFFLYIRMEILIACLWMCVYKIGQWVQSNQFLCSQKNWSESVLVPVKSHLI